MTDFPEMTVHVTASLLKQAALRAREAQVRASSVSDWPTQVGALSANLDMLLWHVERAARELGQAAETLQAEVEARER